MKCKVDITPDTFSQAYLKDDISKNELVNFILEIDAMIAEMEFSNSLLSSLLKDILKDIGSMKSDTECYNRELEFFIETVNKVINEYGLELRKKEEK